MRNIRVWAMLSCCFITLATCAQGQSKQKPGLWEITASMNMSGMPMASQMGSHTSQICVTQAMIDKYGGAYSNPQRGSCQTTNMVVTPAGMTANLSCTGQMSMTGTVQTTFVDANTTKTTVQMTMTMPNGQTMNMTSQSTATYKGPDCGSVKPVTVPPSQ